MISICLTISWVLLIFLCIGMILVGKFAKIDEAWKTGWKFLFFLLVIGCMFGPYTLFKMFGAL